MKSTILWYTSNFTPGPQIQCEPQMSEVLIDDKIYINANEHVVFSYEDESVDRFSRSQLKMNQQ